MKLNLFSSDNLHVNFLNVDKWTPPGAVEATFYDKDKIKRLHPEWPGRFLQADLSKKWPWADGSVEMIRAHDGPEHLRDHIHFMNESWRVLQPGGLLDIFVPTTDGRGAWQDPQHVSMWNPNSLFYFCDYFAEWIRFHEAYGIKAQFRIQGCADAATAWAKITAGHTEYPTKVWKLRVTLEAVK